MGTAHLIPFDLSFDGGRFPSYIEESLSLVALPFTRFSLTNLVDRIARCLWFGGTVPSVAISTLIYLSAGGVIDCVVFILNYA